MQKEGDPQKRATNDSDHELARISAKYLHNRILEDGNSDALAYAVVQVRYAEAWKDGWLKDRWLRAIEEATDGENPSLDRLRMEIEEEGKAFIETPKASQAWKGRGQALLNLARSL